MTKTPPHRALRKRPVGGRREWLSRHRLPVVELLEDRRLLTASPQGAGSRVNQTVSGIQQLSRGGAAVGVDALGNFVIVYAAPGANRTTDIFAQRFAASGAPIGDEIHVNQYVSGSQDLAAVAMRPDGRFVAVWSGKGEAESGPSFFPQLHSHAPPPALASTATAAPT